MTETHKATLGRILVVDDDVDVLQAARLLLRRHAEKVHTAKRPEELPGLLEAETFDLIMLDMNFTRDVSSGREGFYWLDRILELDPDAVVVMITAFGDVETAVQAIKAGATDFVLKPWQNDKLVATLSSAHKLRAARTEATSLRHQARTLSSDLGQPFREFVGRSAPMRRVFEQIEKVAQTDANVLILGENGTGKELVARALHNQSRRADSVFVSVDMGAVSETLFESELFGHRRGAFTDAREDRAGRFEVASGGTLFLDEIGNLSPPLQAKLLTVLQRRHITRLGENRAIPIDVRLICATNRPIGEMVAAGSFRQDLLYRINTVEIHLPPLRDRLEDIGPLAEHFMGLFSRKYNRDVSGISRAALDKLHMYRWPGNVRELEHMVERAIIMTDDPVLQAEDFFFATGHTLSSDAAAGSTMLFDSFNLEEVEKTVIRKAIERHGGNISKAATELGLTRASLYRRMDKYGL